jgi:hypothetical protein
VREPEFNDDDRAAWFSSHAAEKRPRGEHGHLIEDATDPAHQYDWEVPLPTSDFAAKKLLEAQEQYAKAYPDANMKALLWKVTKRAPDTGSPQSAT